MFHHSLLKCRKKNESGETLVEEKEKVCGLLFCCITGGSEFKFPTAWQLLYNVLQLRVRVPNMSQSETC